LLCKRFLVSAIWKLKKRTEEIDEGRKIEDSYLDGVIHLGQCEEEGTTLRRRLWVFFPLSLKGSSNCSCRLIGTLPWYLLQHSSFCELCYRREGGKNVFPVTSCGCCIPLFGSVQGETCILVRPSRRGFPGHLDQVDPSSAWGYDKPLDATVSQTNTKKCQFYYETIANSQRTKKKWFILSVVLVLVHQSSYVVVSFLTIDPLTTWPSSRHVRTTRTTPSNTLRPSLEFRPNWYHIALLRSTTEELYW
jgi:hypothetical protein